MDEANIETRLERIETKLAYLEDFIGRLQDEVVGRNSILDKLLAEQKAMKERVIQIAAEMEEYPDRKPPHY